MSGRGTYNDLNATQLADSASEAIRGLGHLTRDAGSLHTPGEVYTVLGSLSALASRMPQVLAQLDGLLQGWAETDQVRIDGGEFSGDPQAAVAATSVYLVEDAAPALERLSMALDRAQQTIAFAALTGDPDED